MPFQKSKVSRFYAMHCISKLKAFPNFIGNSMDAFVDTIGHYICKNLPSNRKANIREKTKGASCADDSPFIGT